MMKIWNLWFVLFFALGLASCSSKQKAPEETSEPIAESDISSDLADSDSGKAMGLETIYFGFDASTLDSASKGTLMRNAQILKDKPSLKVQIEGHTDERGGIQYNIALGDRRANSVRAFLIDQGVSSMQLTTVSYGKEKPLDYGHDESAWAKNRRANFRITEK